MALPPTMVKPTIFREYIGFREYPDNFQDFPDIIDAKINEFHFIIAFASENYDARGKGTGNFHTNWMVRYFNAEKIHDLKKKCKNVKVLISIGGRGPKYPFNPNQKEMWFKNAKDSLIKIINDFKDPSSTKNLIDGIDINYDTINHGDENVFASCIGKLIKSLKSDDHPSVNVVSIAPSASVRTHYLALYAACDDYIDWVNYQFYTHAIATLDAFNQVYYEQVAEEAYPGHKLLAGFSTDPDDAGKLPREVFIDACGHLINKRELPGIFFWNANDSALYTPRFPLERAAQSLLTQD